MRRTISSAQTFFIKFVFPSVWIGMFGMGTCVLWFDALHDRNRPPPEFMKWAFLVAWPLGSGLILSISLRIKRVQVDHEALYVSNYLSEVRIPISEISHFTQSGSKKMPTITIHLRSLSDVGQRIVFIPKLGLGTFRKHPTILGLRALCDRPRGRDGTGERPQTI
jgi:hypothetical protein